MPGGDTRLSPYPHICPTCPHPYVPISSYPHIPMSLSHVSDPPPPRGTFVPSLKGTEKESGSAVTKPTEPRQCGVGTAPPVSPLPPACVPVSPRPPPHQTPMLPSLKMDLRPRLGAQRGAVGLGRGVWGGLCVCMCVCECTRACTALPPAAGRGQQSCRQRSWVGCEGVHARAGTVCTRRAVRAQRRASPPPLAQLHTYHTHTHTPSMHAALWPSSTTWGGCGGGRKEGDAARRGADCWLRAGRP